MTPIERKFISVLNGPACSRIRFKFPNAGGNVTIAPQTFHLVARAIQSGRVIVRPPNDLAAGRDAQYNAVARTKPDGTVVRANTLEFGALAGRIDESLLVHESLHAAYDLLRTHLNGNADEASAYLCSALYLRMTGLPRPRWIFDRIYASAGRAAQTLLKQYQKGTRGIPTVGETEWQALRLTVALDQRYIGKTGGLGGWLLGREYTHDG